MLTQRHPVADTWIDLKYCLLRGRDSGSFAMTNVAGIISILLIAAALLTSWHAAPVPQQSTFLIPSDDR